MLYLLVVSCIRELSFNKNDIISVIKQVDPNWYEAELKGKVGLVASSYIEVLIHASCGQLNVVKQIEL